MPDEEIEAARQRRLSQRMPVDFGATAVGKLVRSATDTPDQIVALSKTGATTYRQLASRVAAIRRVLRTSGCKTGSVVATLGPRSVETIATFLAVESLGGVYMPLDPTWPESRLAAALARSQPDCVLVYLRVPGGDAARAAVDAAAAAAGTPVLRIDRDEDPPESRVLAADLQEINRPRCPEREPRYIYFTSGTTGEPKGALIEHRGMVNHLWAKVVDLQLGPADTLAFTAPLVFDIAICQMLMPMLVNGTVAVVDDEDVRSPRRLTAELARHRVTVVELVPTVIGWLVTGMAQAPSAAVPPLRCVVSTGEELRPILARQVRQVLPSARLINSFGFTECSDDVAHHLVTERDLDAERIPVGSAVINADLYVLVQDGRSWRAAAHAERGELFVGGIPVGRGYVGNSEATAAAFFHDPFDPSSPTGRLYRTGDMAMIVAGALHYVGRIGRQLKVSGMRVEPDEIEAVLSTHPDVSACSVTARQVDGNTELAAYVVPSDSAPVTHRLLRGYLLDRLPPPMVPSHWFRVDRMPLSVNGKVDHGALEGKRWQTL
ncbi:amino acid adenylation domain-containing protein [Micromonospora marina]|uniref:amino acid adenylation domain-containing protein n=1 Tax=Micromonospora marina TaxID=307120 RepID=UPI003D746CBA